VLTSCFDATRVSPKATSSGQQKGKLITRPYFDSNADDGLVPGMMVTSTRARIVSRRSMTSAVGDDLLRGGEGDKHVKLQPLFSWSKLDSKILAISLPCIVNFAINPLIGAIDLFWVGRMNNALAVAGQAAANQVFNSAFWLVSVLPSVTATMVSQVYTTGDTNKIQETVGQSFFLSAAIGIPCTLFLLARPDQALKAVFQSASAPALEFARPYFIIRALGFMPSLISVLGYSAFRGALDTVTPLRISLFSTVFHAILDPILMFRFNMGIAGAAWAALISEVISAMAYATMLSRKNLISTKTLFQLPKMKRLRPLLQGSAALQLRNVALNLAFLGVTRATQSIDNTGVAASAHSLAMQVFMVGGVVLLALSTVAQTLIPSEMVVQKDGTGGRVQAHRTMIRLMEWGLVLGSTVGALQILILPFLQGLTPLKEVRDAAVIPSYIASFLQVINGMVFIGEGIMVGCGNFFQLSLSTAISTAATAYALHVLPKRYNLTGVWMSFIVFNFSRLIGVWLHQTRTGPLSERNMKKNHLM